MNSRIRWPAEWETQQTCFSAWPYLDAEWLDLSAAQNVISDLSTALSKESDFFLGYESNTVRERAGLPATTRTIELPFGDIWCRDTAPVFAFNDNDNDNGDDNEERVAIVFRWTGWGNKFRLKGDDAFGPAVADLFDARMIRSNLACEGGALETDGAGTIITTRECLLSAERNPSMSADDIERELGETLGAKQIIWLERGLHGDHTDGHVDNLARFVGNARVLCAHSKRDDPNVAVHSQVRRQLEQSRDANGAPLNVESLPSPGLVSDRDGTPMPASYLNFVITNNLVCVPLYSRPADSEALETIAALFPKRRTVGIEATALLYGGGALHCVTSHVPALVPTKPSTKLQVAPQPSQPS